MKLTSGAKPNTKIVIKGGTVKPTAEAEHLKSQGNSFFSSLDYSNAVSCYGRCLSKLSLQINDSNSSEILEMRKVVLSNRAQAYIKLKRYLEAEQDASQALEIDQGHVKSW